MVTLIIIVLIIYYFRHKKLENDAIAAQLEREEAEQRQARFMRAQYELEQYAREKELERQRETARKAKHTKAQIENIELVRDDLFSYMDALNQEEKALLKELPHAGQKRANQINSRLTSIASKRATLSAKIASNDNKVEQLREKLNQ